MNVAYFSHPVFLQHEINEGHPEQPARLQSIQAELIKQQLWERLNHVQADKASQEIVAAFHTNKYCQELEEKSPKQGHVMLDPDTSMNPFSLQAAYLASGAAIFATHWVCEKENRRAFCALRPPGHHAERDRAMGFCLLNHIAISALYALDHLQLKRVAIVDFDVHHGNGTEQVAYGRSDILFCSSFQHPFYPFSGAEVKADNMRMLPLPAGTTGDEFRAMIESEFLPALHEFQPELILISAGFDAHKEDPIGGLNLDESDFAWITRELVGIAEQYAGGRIVSSLEGGYHLDALGRSVSAHIRELL